MISLFHLQLIFKLWDLLEFFFFALFLSVFTGSLPLCCGGLVMDVAVESVHLKDLFTKSLSA